MNISSEQNKNALCLESIFPKNSPQEIVTEDILRVRKHIGLGVTLFCDQNNCVWLYNRSTMDIFVRPLTRDSLNAQLASCSNLIYKLYSGQMIKAYDYKEVCQFKSDLHSNQTSLKNNTDKLIKLNLLLESGSILFSFVKGFGPNYSRKEVMQCPCWLEVILDFANHR